jgi:hypothetical protein
MICVECRWIDTCWRKWVSLTDCPPWSQMILCLSRRVWHGWHVEWMWDKLIGKNTARLLGVCRHQWPRDLRRGSAAARVLWLRVRIPPGHGCLSLVGVVCCQVDVSTTGRSLVQRSPTECLCVTECIKEPHRWGLVPLGQSGRKKKQRGVLW